MNSYHSTFAIGDRVFADGDPDLTMIVTAISFRSSHAQVECSWLSGQAHTAWIEEWRLERAEARS